MTKPSTQREVGPSDRVLVTGAAGGVGRHIVRALLDAGCEVRCVDRRAPDYRTLPELVDAGEVEWITGDLLELDLDELTADCRAVVHTAAYVGLSETYEELAPSNVELTQRLWEAAQRAGARHFIHFSAGTVYEPGRGLRSEDAPIGAATDYVRTKIASEAIFRNAEEPDTDWTILRPAYIYGPHCESMGAGLVTLPPIIRNFTPYLPGFGGGTRSSWVHVEDVAAAAMVILGNPVAYERTFNVSDGTPIGVGEALTAMTEAYGLNIGPVLPFPSPTVLMMFSPVVDREYVASTVRTVLRQLWRRIAARHGLDTPLRPKVDRSVIFYVAEDTVLDSSSLRELGWEPKHASFTEGIGDTIRWYQEHGWTPRFDTEAQVRLRDESEGFGFAFDQMLAGRWVGPDGDEHEVVLQLEVEFPRVSRADLSGRINGTATFEGLVEEADLAGTIELKIFTARRIAYEFGFEAPGGAHRCYIQSSFSALRPISSLSQLEGELNDQLGEHVGGVELNLDLPEQAVPILTSFRLL
jgi:nucleoside-diphosphate-sugar epimerase